MRSGRTEALSAIFGCLADPTRRAILTRLAGKAQSVTELATPFRMSLPAISRHLRVLEDAGLIRRTILGRVHRLRLNAGPMRAAANWIKRYEQFWNERLDALERVLLEE